MVLVTFGFGLGLDASNILSYFRFVTQVFVPFLCFCLAVDVTILYFRRHKAVKAECFMTSACNG